MTTSLAQLQERIERMYGSKDRQRGAEGCFMWFMQEVGELATALRAGTKDELTLEFADVLAWLTTLANLAGVSLEDAIARKYGQGCPGCQQIPCACHHAEKP